MLEPSNIVLCCLAALYYASPGTDSEGTASKEDTGCGGEEAKATREKNALILMDFVEESKDWRNIDDVVMGGVSSSRIRIIEGVAVFEGNVSLENNGGFASVRSKPRENDLSKAQGVLLRVRGDGKRYAFRLRTTDTFGGINYEARFKTVAEEWKTVDIPFKAFRPVLRGRLVREADPLDLKSIKTFGFLISDKQEGPFRLEIDWIKTYADEPKV